MITKRIASVFAAMAVMAPHKHPSPRPSWMTLRDNRASGKTEKRAKVKAARKQRNRK